MRSTMSSRSICAREAITLKKQRPEAVVVSIESVRLTKPIPRSMSRASPKQRSVDFAPS